MTTSSFDNFFDKLLLNVALGTYFYPFLAETGRIGILVDDFRPAELLESSSSSPPPVQEKMVGGAA